MDHLLDQIVKTGVGRAIPCRVGSDMQAGEVGHGTDRAAGLAQSTDAGAKTGSGFQDEGWFETKSLGESCSCRLGTIVALHEESLGLVTVFHASVLVDGR